MRVLRKELWPHCVRLDIEETGKDMSELEIWLGNTLGQFKDQWNCVYHYNGTDFYFRNSKDATFFMLRWA